MRSSILSKFLRGALIAVIAFDVFVWASIARRAWVSQHNRPKPCVPYHDGMTLEPGQCASITLKAR